jgi:glycosyltransferase involved in cell wall biosynthesis
MHVTLIVPAPLVPISSIRTYSREMTDSLRALGHGADLMELPGRFADPDQTATDAAQACCSQLRDDTIPLIDALALPAFGDLTTALGPRHGAVLIHHPTSWETGVSEEIARRRHVTDATLFRAMPRLVATSPQTADRVAIEFGIERDRISVITPGITDLPRSPGNPSGSTCAMLSVGALIPRKGHDVLLRALSRLFDLDWQLTIVGTADSDPVHAQGLLALAEELHIARHVQFAGAVDAPALDALLVRRLRHDLGRSTAARPSCCCHRRRRRTIAGRARSRRRLCTRGGRAVVQGDPPFDLRPQPAPGDGGGGLAIRPNAAILA